MTESATLKLLVATFSNDAGAARALATLAPALGPDAIGQAAVVSRRADGKVRFSETNDTTTAEGAWRGAGIGALAGLLVAPVSQLPGIVLDNGGTLAILTESETPYDGAAQIRLHGRAAAQMQEAVAALDALGRGA